MFENLTESLTLFIPFVITMATLIILSVYVTYRDFKVLKVKVWLLLLFPLISFLGVYVARAIHGTFQWYFLLAVPIYILIEIINVKWNNNKIIGQGDLDILGASIALAVPISIGLMNVTYDIPIDIPIGSANTAHVMAFLGASLVWLLVGYLGTMAIFLAYYAIKKKRSGKKPEGGLRKSNVPIILGYIPLLLWMVYAGMYVVL